MTNITMANFQCSIDCPSILLDIVTEFSLLMRITKTENYHLVDVLRGVDFSYLKER